MALKPDGHYKIRSIENDTKPINKRLKRGSTF